MSTVDRSGRISRCSRRGAPGVAGRRRRVFPCTPNDSGEVWCALVCSCPTLRWFWALFRLRVGPFAMFLSDAVDWAAHKRPYSASPTLPQRSIHDWRDPSNMHSLNSASFLDNALRLRRSTHDCGGGDLLFAAPGLTAKAWASWSSGSWEASTKCTSLIQLAWTAPLSLVQVLLVLTTSCFVLGTAMSRSSSAAARLWSPAPAPSCVQSARCTHVADPPAQLFSAPGCPLP